MCAFLIAPAPNLAPQRNIYADLAGGMPAVYLMNMTTFFNVLIPVAMLTVFVTLCVGVFALFRGGDFGRTWSNRMMRMRVLTQFVAVLILLAALLWKQNVGG